MVSEIEILKEIQKDIDLSIFGTISKESILNALEYAISRLLEQNAEPFFQFMYRLDIAEFKMAQALYDKQHTVPQLAILIYERQLQKLSSRLQFRNKENDIDTDLAW